MAALLLTSPTAPLLAQAITNKLFRIAPEDYATVANKPMVLLAAEEGGKGEKMITDLPGLPARIGFVVGISHTQTQPVSEPSCS